MGRPERALYSSARRLLRRFESQGIPFTGVAGTYLVAWNLDPAHSIASWLRQPAAHQANTLEEGLQLLNRLETQLAVLQQAEEHTREALAEWQMLMKHHRRSLKAVGDTTAAAQACEAGMQLLSEQVESLADPLGLLDDSDADSDTKSVSIKELAAAIIEQIGKQHSGGSDASPQIAAEKQLEIVSKTLYKDYKLKYEPFEWVYEGLDPLLLPKVLQKRQGTPAALAILATSVGCLAGVPLLPLPAVPIEAGAENDPSSAANVAPETLPPDLALRLNSTTQAAAPGPGTWLLKFLPSQLSSSSGLYLDAGTGEVLDSKTAEEKFPFVGYLSDQEWLEKSVLASWQGLARLAIQGHQRRGESDLVAHWMYITLALDPKAPEWGRALMQPEISG